MNTFLIPHVVKTDFVKIYAKDFKDSLDTPAPPSQLSDHRLLWLLVQRTLPKPQAIPSKQNSCVLGLESELQQTPGRF